jgi:intergrase/recombinase
MRTSSEVITHNLEIERRQGILLQSKLSELRRQVAEKKASMRDVYINAEKNKKKAIKLKNLKVNLNKSMAELGELVSQNAKI